MTMAHRRGDGRRDSRNTSTTRRLSRLLPRRRHQVGGDSMEVNSLKMYVVRRI